MRVQLKRRVCSSKSAGQSEDAQKRVDGRRLANGHVGQDERIGMS
jgi:hypothetical protein